jgi:hypothetical protein
MNNDKTIYFIRAGEGNGTELLPLKTPIRVAALGRTTAKEPPMTEKLTFAWEYEGNKYVGEFQVTRENYGIKWDGDTPKMNLDEAILEGWLDMDINGKNTKTFVVKAQLFLRIGV